MRVKICKKEAKETLFWLKLLKPRCDIKYSKELDILIDEATQLMRIFGAILEKSKEFSI